MVLIPKLSCVTFDTHDWTMIAVDLTDTADPDRVKYDIYTKLRATYQTSSNKVEWLSGNEVKFNANVDSDRSMKVDEKTT